MLRGHGSRDSQLRVVRTPTSARRSVPTPGPAASRLRHPGRTPLGEASSAVERASGRGRGPDHRGNRRHSQRSSPGARGGCVRYWMPFSRNAMRNVSTSVSSRARSQPSPTNAPVARTSTGSPVLRLSRNAADLLRRSGNLRGTTAGLERPSFAGCRRPGQLDATSTSSTSRPGWSALHGQPRRLEVPRVSSATRSRRDRRPDGRWARKQMAVELRPL